MILNRLAGRVKNAAQKFSTGFDRDYGVGQEDARNAFHAQRALEGKTQEAPRIEALLSTTPTIYRTKDLLGKSSTEEKEARKDMGMDLSSDPAERAGQVAGTVAGDLTQDNSRRIWWLLNAFQAVGETVNEKAIQMANTRAAKNTPERNLYGKTVVTNEAGSPINAKSEESLKKAGVLNKAGKLQRGYERRKKTDDIDYDHYAKRNFEPGYIQSLAIPTGIAINTGLGLMTPFGGAEGYKAAIPSEEDPTKTDNMLGEVALKYVMGRTGNLLPYEDFVKVRPDVSRDEYNRYQAFKYDKNEDWNPTDGDLTLLAGAIKATNEGIHGPEVQFLGRGLPVTTGVVPYLGALAGGAYGVTRPRPIRGGFLGGMGGLAAGQVVGQLLEGERRRRNAEENNIVL